MESSPARPPWRNQRQFPQPPPGAPQSCGRMNGLRLCQEVVNNVPLTYARILPTPAGVPVGTVTPKGKAHSQDLYNPTKPTPPSPPPPGGKQHCLTSAIREPTEQYWRPEAAAAATRTERGVKSVKITTHCSLGVFQSHFDN